MSQADRRSDTQAPPAPNYWFRAKRYGWGWGLPLAWQGWVVLSIYGVAVLAGIPLLRTTRGTAVYVAYVMACSAVLTLVCWLKGEPARWRWGRADD